MTLGGSLLASLTLAIAALPIQAATRSVPAGSTQAQIQTILNGAVSGDVISFAAGTYSFTGALTLKSGLIIEGNSCTWVGSSTSTIVKVIDTAALTNVTIRNLKTRNVHFRFWASNLANLKGITVSNVEFKDGRAESGMSAIDSRFVTIKAGGVTVTGCKFLRTSGFAGKGIQLYLAQNTTITNCLFGTTSATTPNPSTNGFFKTCINTNNDTTNGGFVTNTSITSNHLYRASAMSDDAAYSDHGIYALGFDGLTLSNNTINGWPAAASGGAVKLRQAQNGTVQNNTFVRSGVLLYIYDNNPNLFLKNIKILSNTITCASYDGVPHIYDGIGFWRNYSTTDVAEYSIRIEGNTISRGAICLDNANIHTSDINANGGGVFNNTINTGGISLKPGIAQSGNVIR